MKKKTLAIILTLMMCLNLLPSIALADTIENSDSQTSVQADANVKPDVDEDGVYQIANGEDLEWFAALVNGTLTDGTSKDNGAKAVLVSDITLGEGSAETNWTPIGNYSEKYTGSFDGAGHTIKGLNIESDKTYQGLFGYVGTTGVVKNVTVEGSISSSKNFVGGIAGYNAGNIEGCCNKARVTSTKQYVGGIVGNNNGLPASYANIISCYNVGHISGGENRTVSNTGGITGKNTNANISSCYNVGTVESKGSKTGGLAGYAYSGNVSNCYNVGIVTSTSASDVGAAFGWGHKTKVQSEKIYYLDGAYTVGIGNDGGNKNIIAKSSDGMKTNDFVAELGGSFVADNEADQNKGYPILGWQNPNAKCIATFEINQEEAEVVVKNSEDNVVTAEEDGTYSLDKGTYSYTVSKEGFKTVEGSFSINSGGEKIIVNLEAETFLVTFDEVKPSDSNIVVKNSNGDIQIGSGLVYNLPKGDYTYIIEKFGFEPVEDSFNVNDIGINIPSIELKEAIKSVVTFNISFADNNVTAVEFISVKHGENVQAKNADGSYSLADGEYTYSIACNGYKSIMGNIVVKGEAIHIEKTMEVRTVWSGNSEEPAYIVKEGKIYYQIANGENLAWFSKYVNDGNVSANAVVVGNIVLSDDEKENTWTSIGSNTNQYNGTFDGQGHKITGLKGSNGLFAYSNNNSIVKNVVVEGIITEAGGNVGGIMGTNYGRISKCSFNGSIVSTGQRVGGIAGNNSFGTIENCANYANVKTSTIYYVTQLDLGGIAGQSSGSIKNCYSVGEIKGSCPDEDCGEVGGITGNSSGTIENCYNIGDVIKEEASMGKIGAIAGISSGSAINCYYLEDSFNIGLGSGLGDAVAKTSAELKEDALVTVLGEAFNKGYSGEKAINNGYPVLKWQGGVEVGGDADLEAVTADRNSLQIEQLTITQATTLNLPVSGEHGSVISWNSSNVDIITKEGNVSFPQTGNIKVVLTATITKGKVSQEKSFELTVKSQGEVAKDYLENAKIALERSVSVLSPVSGTDTNIITTLQNKLNNLGYSGITVVLVDNVDETYIAQNGDITYFYVNPELTNIMGCGQVRDLKFTLSKEQQCVDYVVNAVICWDRDKVIQTMTEQIAQNLTFDLIKDQNKEITAIEGNLILPQKLKGKEWATISWESNSPYLSIPKKENDPNSDLIGKVTKPQNDLEVKLTATITFNKTAFGEQEEKITINKEFNLVLQRDTVDWPTFMQEQLNEKYTADKLKIFGSDKKIDPENVTDDIQLLTKTKVGIGKYGEYDYTVESSDEDVIEINSFRAKVYRPLPGESAKTVTLTVSMKKTGTDIIVTKKINLTVQPFTQAEINEEIALMEKVKANYAMGILDGMSADQVTKNLHPFKECHLDSEGNLVWIYALNDCREMGIEPIDLPKEEYSEAYRLYHSSESTIITHENLVLKAPEYDTEVIIKSNLQSIKFAKYAERYPNNEDLKKLINQLVTAKVIAKGSKGTENPHDEETETEVTAMIKSQAEGAFLVAPQKIKVLYDLAESYGYIDEVDNHVSALDVLVKEHELVFGEAFTKETKNDLLKVGSNGFISAIFGIPSSASGFSVNGKTPNDGIYNETYGSYTGYNVNQTQINEDDVVDFFIFKDATDYSDYYTWFEEGNEIETNADIPFDLSLKGFSIAKYGMKDDNEIKLYTENIAGAQLSLVDENGAITPIQNVVTDTNGKVKLTLSEGTYYITATRENLTPIILPLSKITVKVGESLQDKKTAAIKELTKYKDSSDYREAEQKQLEDTIGKGTTSINNAETIVLVQEALAEAKKEIDEIKTDAQLDIEEKIANEQVSYDAIYEGLKKYNGGEPTVIVITNPYKGTEKEIENSLVNLYLNVLFEHPELFYVKTEYKIQIEGNTVSITPTIIEPFNESEKLNAAKDEIQEVLNSAIDNCISEDMTDLEKLLSLHDWLVNHCQYNKIGHMTGEAEAMNAYTAYGALVDADAVCQGYSMALNLLLEKASVESHYVSGNNHSWNVVKISGTWYHVDSTWDDKSPDRPGTVKHDYFLLSDDEIKDTKYHSNWSTRHDIKCLQSYVDDAPWKASTLQFVYDAKEKAFFNVENKEKTTKYRKVSFDIEGNADVKVLQNLALKNIVAQTEYKGILYLVDNTGDIYAYDLKNKTKKILLDEIAGIDLGYGVLISNEKLIVRANYKDVETLELYSEKPISTELNKPSAVAAFMPAPGQFINKTEMVYNSYPNPEVTLQNPLSEKVVSLGSYGGYIVYEFDKPITNNANNPYGIDFIVYGNAVNGKSEPAAVVVSNDGKTWYELAGSEYYNADTKRNLSITYTNPDTTYKEAVNIPWTTSDNKTGYVYKNGAHTQAYYPNIELYKQYNKGISVNSNYSNEKLSFVGNKISEEGTYSFGYADSHGTGNDNVAVNPYASNIEKYNGDGMDLAWAIDKDGNPVKIDSVKYIKLYTAVIQDNGTLGESSSEVAGIFEAQGKETVVGITNELKEIKINDETISLIDGKFNYVYDATNSKSLVITATGEATDNIFINNKSVNSGVECEPLALTGKVRIIAQNGEKEPVIYIINIKGIKNKDKEIELTNHIVDLIITKLPSKTVYKVGEKLDTTGIEVKGKYVSDGAIVLKDIELNKCVVEGFDSNKIGAQNVTLSYYEDYYDSENNFIKRIDTSAIYVVNVKENEAEKPIKEEQKVTLTIKGAKGKTWTSDSYVINPGVTSVMDALKAVLALNGTTYTIKSGDKYISSIDGLGEFDLGKNSGWLVKVDNSLIEVSAADWKLNGGEKIVWFYTEDWTKVHGTKKWTDEEEIAEEKANLEETKIISGTTKVSAKTDNQGKASASIEKSAVNDAISKVLKDVESAKKQGITANKEVIIEVSTDKSANSVETIIPRDAVTELHKKVDKVKVSTSIGEVTFDKKAFETLTKQEAGELKFTIAKKDAEKVLANVKNISNKEKQKINEGKIFEFSVTADSKAISQLESDMEINIPYKKLANQKSEAIVAYEISSDGTMKPVIGGKIEKDENFAIKSDHFSTYVIAYNDVNFADTNSHWAESNITYLAAREVIKGMTESTFEPNANITRAQFVQILANMSGTDLTKYEDSKFKDVNDNAWYAKVAAWASESGLVTGNANTDGTASFNPNQNITRQDMAVILSRYMSKIKQKKLSQENKEIVFADEKQISSYAETAVKELQKSGVINGKSANSFEPKQNATRAECSKMISVLIQNNL